MTDKPDRGPQPTTPLPAEQGTAPEPSVTWEPPTAEAMITGTQPAPEAPAAFAEQAPGEAGPTPRAEQAATPQPASSGGATPPPPPPPAVPAPRRPPHMTRTWIAAAVAAVLLVGGGAGGYFIGAANDHRDHGPGWSEQWGPRDGFRGDGGPDGPWNR